MSDARKPEDKLYGSWVEVEAKEPTEAVSRGESLTGPSDTSSPSLQGELERILLEAQLECERYRDSPPWGVSPPQSSGSPRSASNLDGDFITIQEETDRRGGGSDWVWDWASRPENVPLKDFVFQHPKQQGSLSVRNTDIMKRGVFSFEVLFLLIPSLLASHLLALGIGIYIGKRLAESATSTL